MRDGAIETRSIVMVSCYRDIGRVKGGDREGILQKSLIDNSGEMECGRCALGISMAYASQDIAEVPPLSLGNP